MAIDFNQAQTGNFAQALLGGYQAGRAIGQQKRTDAALRGFQADPDAAISEAYAFDPDLGDRLSQRRARTLYSDALVSGQAPSPEIARLDPKLWKELDDKQKAQIKLSTEFLSNAAFDIGKRPEAERPAAWGAYVKQAEASGMDIPSQYETYSPEALSGIVAQAGHTKDFLKAVEPDDMKVIGLGNGAYAVQRGNSILDPKSGQWLDYGGGAKVAPQASARPTPDADDIAEAMRDPQARAEFEQFFGASPDSFGGPSQPATGRFP